jgi:hypothetical protein
LCRTFWKWVGLMCPISDQLILSEMFENWWWKSKNSENMKYLNTKTVIPKPNLSPNPNLNPNLNPNPNPKCVWCQGNSFHHPKLTKKQWKHHPVSEPEPFGSVPAMFWPRYLISGTIYFIWNYQQLIENELKLWKHKIVKDKKVLNGAEPCPEPVGDYSGMSPTKVSDLGTSWCRESARRTPRVGPSDTTWTPSAHFLFYENGQ